MSLPEKWHPEEILDLSLGKALVGNGREFALTEEQMATHMAVLGGTGSGKSKFLELVMRMLLVSYRGFCLIDPHGDLSEDILAYAAKRRVDLGTDAILKRIHYLEPSYETLFGYDPFQFRPAAPIPEGRRESAYQAWLHTKVDRVSEIIQRKQGQTDFEGMPRLQRILRNVLYAVGVAVDETGKHLPLADALVLLDVRHPRHQEVYDRVTPYLPREIIMDLERLKTYRRDEDRLRETESTINRLRSLFSPILQAIFSRTDRTIDFRSVIADRGILLVNLRETDYFSADQANALGGMIIHEILSTAATTHRERRTPFYLFIDEAARFVGDDLQRALGECRKFKLSVCLAAQDLSSFLRKDFDMSRKVLSQCRTLISFQQQHPDDLEVLAGALGYGNLDFTQLEQVVDRPDGFDWVQVEERSEGEQWGLNWNESTSDTESASRSQQETESESRQQNWSKSKSRQVGHGESDSSGHSQGSSSGDSAGQSVSYPAGPSDPSGPRVTQSRGSSGNRSEQSSSSHSTSHYESQGTSQAQGGGEGFSSGTSFGNSFTSGRTEGESRGGSMGDSKTISYKWVHLQKYREERHKTGRLEMSIDDQFHRMKQQLHSLRKRQAIVKLPDVVQAFVMEVHEVREPFPTTSFKSGMVEDFKRVQTVWLQGCDVHAASGSWVGVLLRI